MHLFVCDFNNFRAQEVPVRNLLPVWTNLGYRGDENTQDERTSLRHLQGSEQCDQRYEIYAGFSFL